MARKKKIDPLHLFCYIVILIQILLYCALTVPSLFGYKPYALNSSSMSPVINKGDLIYIRNSDPGLLEAEDIICFYPDEYALTLQTQKVITNDPDRQLIETIIDDETGKIPYSCYMGKVAFHLPLLGYLGRFLSTIAGRIVYLAILGTMILLIKMFYLSKRA